MNEPVEETVVVTVGLIGMAGTGTGTESFKLDLTHPEVALGVMFQAFQTALGRAMGDVFEEFKEYTRSKYGDQEVDNGEGS